MTQKEAVYKAITAVLDEDDIDFEPGEQNIAPMLRGERRIRVVELLVNGFMSKDIPLSEEAEGMDEQALKAYAISLVSHWLRKDSRLNGGIHV